jgi:SAM-dependent methyltransferase
VTEAGARAGRESGARRIFFYNWPIYLLAWAVGPALAISALYARLPGAVWVGLGAGTALLWSALSLAVSFYIYDRSELSRGRWVRALAPERVDAWVSVDAGLDAEIDLDGALPGECLGCVDIFDGSRMPAGSIRRARARTPRTRAAIASPPTALATRDASCDAVVVAFTAHELRDASTRERFFHELFRTLRPRGRVLLVEHVRDAANCAVYGPGAFHFLPRAEWLRVARVAGFHVAAERRVTPFVVALALEKAA